MGYINVVTLLIGFVASALLGPVFIPLLIKLKFGQSIREIGPKWHEKKSGTPTMGGIIFILALAISATVLYKYMDLKSGLVLFCALGFGVVGFLDDFIKVVLKRNLGLKAWQKLALQIVVSVIFVLVGLDKGVLSLSINIPFTDFVWDMGWLYIPFAIFVLLAVVNGVNLTDGIDGLATCVTIVVMVFFAVITSILNSLSVSLLCYALTGALLGFLIYNKNPARVFMGDTGSLMLGGMVGALSLMTGNPLILILVGIIYFVETLSVIMQVASFKLTGKRIFKMSPIHHHFEMCGWNEKKIDLVFTLTTVLFCIISYFGVRL
ncbi:MAG: phospho-N-acetylmuramoyl-pentapeptide-transferase [Clostridia bacterium]|nr:phospho-N-acetylmuramoyl-pentapeptide-transferase [Clostridia bacterium]